MVNRSALLAATALLWLPVLAHAGGGPFGIDHRVTYDNSGIWKRNYQKDLAAGATLTVIGGALFAARHR